MRLEFELNEAIKSDSKERINFVFEKIYDNYFKLGMFIARQYNDEHNSLEIVEEIFVSFFENILKEKKCRAKNIKQYICASIKNASIRFKMESQKNINFDDNLNYYGENENIYLLETFFAELTAEEQLIITDHIILEKTFKEIASDFKKPLNTIKSIYRRGILKARRKEVWSKNK